MSQQADETILFEVAVNIPNVKENAETALAYLTKLREEKEKTQKAFASNLLGEDTYKKTLQSLNTEIDKTEKELASYNKTIADHDKAQKTNADTLAKVATGMNNLASGQTKLTGSTNLVIKSVHDEAKALMDATQAGKGFSDFVAGLNDKMTYQKTISQATAASMDDLDKIIANLENGYEGLTKAQRDDVTQGGILLKLTGELSRVQKDNRTTLEASKKTVGDYIKSINILGINVGETITSFREGGIGIKTFTSSIFTARGALIALTAIPIVALLSGLYIILTKTQAGMDLVARAGGAISAVFNVIVRSGVDLTKAFIQLFTAPKEAIESFYRILKGLPAQVSAAASAGAAVVDMNNKIAESEREILVTRAKNRAEVERLKKVSEDTTKSIEERQAAAQAAYNLENKTLQGLIGVQAQRVEAAKKELALSQQTREDKQKVADEEIKLAEMREESLGKQTELQNQLNQLTTEGIQQRVTKELSAIDNEIAGLQKVGGARGAYYKQLQTLQSQRLQKQFELDTAGMVKSNDQYKALKIKLDADIAKLDYDTVVAQSELIDRVTNDQLETKLIKERKGSIDYLKIQQEQIDQQLLQQTEAASRLYKIEEEKEAAILKLEEKAAEDKKAIDKQIKQVEIQNANDLLEARLARTRAGSKAELQVRVEQIQEQLKNALEDEDVSAEQFVKIQAQAFRQIDDLQKQYHDQTVDKIVGQAQQITGALSNIFQVQADSQAQMIDQQEAAALNSAGLSAEAREKIQSKYDQKRADAEKKAAEQRREIALIEAIINTASSIAKVSYDPFQVALAAIVGAAQIAVIEAQQFAQGGVIDGPSHAEGGVKYNVGGRRVELEGEEGVINKRSMAMPGVRQKASELNQLGGGIAFPGTLRIVSPMPTPKPYNPALMANGGILGHAVTTYNQINAPAPIDYNQLGRTVSKMVVEAVKSLPPQYVRVGEIQNGIAQKVKVENRASS